MSRFEDYAEKFSCIRRQRRDGILEIAFHSDGGPLRWGMVPHGELPEAFNEIGRDRENRVVIMTGTGDEFSGVRATPETTSLRHRIPAEAYDRIH